MGGGGSYTNWDSQQLSGAVRKESDKASVEFEQELAKYLSVLLATFNSRDAELVRQRLDEAKTALRDELTESIDDLFGGSVAKHTYVDGLSDIDSLLVIDHEKLGEMRPADLLKQMEGILRKNLPQGVEISHGQIALTLTYADGMSIQLLPAFRTETGLRIPSDIGNKWSDIDTEAFRQALTRRNQQCAGKLVPTIKLAKAVLANLPEKYRLTGYHVESLGISAFNGYQGTKITAIMLPYFIERSKELVLSPIRDRTGQSIHVDEYLGPENSQARQDMSHILTRLAKRMRNASAAKSNSQWQSIFVTEE